MKNKLKIPAKIFTLTTDSCRVMLRANSVSDAIRRLPPPYKEGLKKKVAKEFGLNSISDKRFRSYLRNIFDEKDEKWLSEYISSRQNEIDIRRHQLEELEWLLKPVGVVRPHFFTV